jgi:hypothetical protein
MEFVGCSNASWHASDESPIRRVAAAVISGGGGVDQFAENPEVGVLAGRRKRRSTPPGGQANRQVVAKANRG